MLCFIPLQEESTILAASERSCWQKAAKKEKKRTKLNLISYPLMTDLKHALNYNSIKCNRIKNI